MGLVRKKQKPPEKVHNGKTWRHMPGNDAAERMLNFALFCRGLLKPSDTEEVYSRDVMLPPDYEKEQGQLIRRDSREWQKHLERQAKKKAEAKHRAFTARLDFAHECYAALDRMGLGPSTVCKALGMSSNSFNRQAIDRATEEFKRIWRGKLAWLESQGPDYWAKFNKKTKYRKLLCSQQ
jgi:hypothetical protein